MKRRKGQNLIEFLIIIALVALGGIIVLSALGVNITQLIGSSETKVKQFDPFGTGYDSTDPSTGMSPPSSPAPSPSTPSATLPADIMDTQNIDGYDVNILSDGSASFEVGGQSINLPAQILELQADLYSTTGASGLNDLIKEVAYMVQAHQAEYPSENVPVEISFGTGIRYDPTEPSFAYKGATTVNTTAIKVGGHMVIIQQDQDYPYDADFAGKYRIEGTLTPDNKLNTTVTSTVGSDTYSGTFSGTVDMTDGLKISDASYSHQYETSCYLFMSCTEETDYNWSIDFTDPDQSFNL